MTWMTVLFLGAIFGGVLIFAVILSLLGDGHRGNPPTAETEATPRGLANGNAHRSRWTCHKPECMRENQESSKFCGACGADLHDPARRYHVLLVNAGTSKINAIIVIRKALDLGLKEAKDLADRPPQVVGLHLNEEQARRLSEGFTHAGATVETRLAVPSDGSAHPA